MSQVLVTPRSLTAGGHPALERLESSGFRVVYSPAGRQPTEDELVALLPGCVGYLAGVEPVTARVLEAAADLRVISRNGTGVDNIDLDVARQRDICVCRAEGANAQGVAELAIGLLFSLARSIPTSNETMRAGLWQRARGRELRGKTLGVIGCGMIGRLVTEMAIGLGMAIVAYDKYPDTSYKPSDQFRFAACDEVLRTADAASLHCPAQANGEPLIDAGALAQMRQGVLIINTARYSLIEATAMTAALDSGRVAGLALDVFDREPPSANPLIRHERVISTPHVGGFTTESVDRAVSVAVDNLLRHLRAL